MGEYLKEHQVHSEGLLKWVFDKEGVSPNTTSIRFSRVRASGKILTLPADPDEQDFSDDSHLPQWSLKRTPLGNLPLPKRLRQHPLDQNSGTAVKEVVLDSVGSR